MSASLHEKVYQFLENYRKEKPDFRHWMTTGKTKRAKEKLSEGYWFQGVPEKNEVFVGLYAHNCSARVIRSLSLHFKEESENRIIFSFQVSYDTNDNPRVIQFFNKLVEELGDFSKTSNSNNYIAYRQPLFFDTPPFEKARQFLEKTQPKIDHLIKEFGLEKDFFIPKDTFEHMTKLVAEHRGNDNPITLMLEKYKALIKETQLKEEIFKWHRTKLYKGKPDIKAVDFYKEVKSLDFNHLCYQYSTSTLRDLANNKPTETASLFEHLQNDTIDLQERVTFFSKEANKLFNELRPSENVKGHQDERTISTYLAFYDANLYPFYKNSFYKKFCKLIKVKPAKTGEKYLHYISLIQQFIKDYISKDQELLALKQKLLDDTCHEDKNHLILAQDILYQILDEGRADEDNEVEAITQTNEVKTNIELNQILFGPPGTGKTYTTINKALEICGIDIPNDREDVKELFNQKVAEGQIVFTTFHQSMSYEDFIEGIKPQEPNQEGESISFKVEDGIFKQMAYKAAFAIAQEGKLSETKEVLDFSSSYNFFTQQLGERLSQEEQVSLVTRNGGKIFIEAISAQGNIIIKHLNGSRTYTVSKPRLIKLQKAVLDLKAISNIDDKFREIIGGSNSSAYWAVLNAIRKEKYTSTTPTADKAYGEEDIKEVVLSMKPADYKNNNGKPYVLIIDEINRGNVSEIFGELITLLERDKRLGHSEALEVMLPYSKVKFGVPKNLYLIGTMNTADRSVEALDTALRRRFNFEEVAPNTTLIREKGGVVEDIDLANLLNTINNRIEKLMDKDHLIGHSYFLNVNTLSDLMTVFYKNIIPLLQEHFFGDYGKIGLILGEGFVQEKQSNSTFAKFNYETQGLEERKIYKIHDFRKEELIIGEQHMNFIQAISTLLVSS